MAKALGKRNIPIRAVGALLVHATHPTPVCRICQDRPRMRSTRGVVALAVALALAGLATMSFESTFLYFPQRAYDALPADYGLSSDDVALDSTGGVSLRGWWIHGEGKRMLVYLHGNGGNISHRLDRTRRIVDALRLDVLLIDYRGYGLSTGHPGEAGLYADGDAIYRAARSRGFEPGRIVLFGESLGCAVAVEVAARHKAAALILESPFVSIPAMARAHYPFVPSVLIRSRFDNGAKIGSLRLPKLIVCAERDEVVPPEQTRKVFELASPPKRFFQIPGARHNDGYIAGGADYMDQWRDFLEEYVTE